MEPKSPSHNWLKSLLLACFFFLVETTLTSTIDINDYIDQINTKEQEKNINQKLEKRINLEPFVKPFFFVVTEMVVCFFGSNASRRFSVDLLFGLQSTHVVP